MGKIIYINFLFLFLSLNVSAQLPVSTDRPRWIRQTHDFGYNYRDTFTVNTETTICGYIYQVVERKTSNPFQTNPYYFYYRLENSKVWVRESSDCNIAEKMALDFHESVGNIMGNFYCGVKVDSIKTIVTKNNVSRSNLMGNKYSNDPHWLRPTMYQLVRGIGLLSGPFDFYGCGERGREAILESLDSAGIRIYDRRTTSANNVQNEKIYHYIYPNPTFDGNCTLHTTLLQQGTIKICDVAGKIIKTQRFEANHQGLFDIYIPGDAGVYFIYIKTGANLYKNICYKIQKM